MKCIEKTKRGQPCRMPAIAGSKYCFTHSPNLGAARAVAHKTGGERTRAKHAGNADALPSAARTMGDVMQILDYTLAESIPLENSIQRGRLLIALVAGYVAAIQVGELELRIMALENALRARKD